MILYCSLNFSISVTEQKRAVLLFVLNFREKDLRGKKK